MTWVKSVPDAQTELTHRRLARANALEAFCAASGWTAEQAEALVALTAADFALAWAEEEMNVAVKAAQEAGVWPR